MFANMGAFVDFGFEFFSFIIHVVDLGSDIWLLYIYYTHEHWYWFTISVVALAVPAFILNIGSCAWFCTDSDASALLWLFRSIFGIAQVSTIWRYVKLLLILLI